MTVQLSLLSLVVRVSAFYIYIKKRVLIVSVVAHTNRHSPAPTLLATGQTSQQLRLMVLGS
jgi:hypothetical protein